MPDFEVALQTASGERRTRLVQAADAGQVAAALGVAPRQLLSVRAVKNDAAKRSHTPERAGAGALSLRFFSQELAVLLDAGITLPEALKTLEQKERRSPVARCLARLGQALNEGQTFSVALARQPEVFNGLFVAIVRANERTGSLPAALRAHARYMAWADELRSRLVGALIYPTLLLLVGSGVLMFLLLFVLPRFAGVLDTGATPLSGASALLYGLGSAGADHPWLASLVWAAPWLLLLLAWRHPVPRAALVLLSWRLPGLGQRLRVLALAAIYRGVGMLLQAGIPTLSALQMVQGIAAAPLQDAVARAAVRLSDGQRLSTALDAEGLATPVAQRMLRVGESSGEVAHMLEHAATFHDEELQRLADWVTHALNPLLMALMGVLIGAVVVLMYLPIFDLIDRVQ